MGKAGGGHTSVHDSGATIEHQVALVQRWDMMEQVEGPQVPLASLLSRLLTTAVLHSIKNHIQHLEQEPNTKI